LEEDDEGKLRRKKKIKWQRASAVGERWRYDADGLASGNVPLSIDDRGPTPWWSSNVVEHWLLIFEWPGKNQRAFMLCDDAAITGSENAHEFSVSALRRAEVLLELVTKARVEDTATV
jgi:hypothetical protein